MQHGEHWKCINGWCSAAHGRVQAVPGLPETWEIVTKGRLGQLPPHNQFVRSVVRICIS